MTIHGVSNMLQSPHTCIYIHSQILQLNLMRVHVYGLNSYSLPLYGDRFAKIFPFIHFAEGTTSDGLLKI